MSWIPICRVLAIVAICIAIPTLIYAILVAFAVAVRCPSKIQYRMHIIVSILLLAVVVCDAVCWIIFAANGLYGDQGNNRGRWGFNCMVAVMFLFAFCTVAYYCVKRGEVPASGQPPPAEAKKSKAQGG